MLGVVLGPWPDPVARASCAAPMIALADGTTRVSPGEALTVEGTYFVHGCNDSGGGTAFGCSDDESEPQTPYRDVALVLRQRGHEWVLGTEDADAASGDRFGEVTWVVTLPADLRPGRARLSVTSGAALSLPVTVRRPATRSHGSG